MTTAQDQQSRAEFEADWRIRHAPLPMNTRMHDDGRYGDPRIQGEWEAWQAARAVPAGMEPVAWVDLQEWPPIRWPNGTTRADYYPIDGMALYTAAQVLAMGHVPPGCMAVPVELLQDAEQALANFVSEHDWGDADMVAMDNLSAALAAAQRPPTAPERKPLTDERIRQIDDETHFHESPDWPVRFARAIEAELGKAPAP